MSSSISIRPRSSGGAAPPSVVEISKPRVSATPVRRSPSEACSTTACGRAEGGEREQGQNCEGRPAAALRVQPKQASQRYFFGLHATSSVRRQGLHARGVYRRDPG